MTWHLPQFNENAMMVSYMVENQREARNPLKPDLSSHQLAFFLQKNIDHCIIITWGDRIRMELSSSKTIHACRQ